MPRPSRAGSGRPRHETASAQIKRGTSGAFEFALGAEPVSELVGAALFEVNEVRPLGDLVVSALAGLRLGRSRVRSVTGGLVGLAAMMVLPCSRSTRWVQAASRRLAAVPRAARVSRARQRSSTHIDAGPPGDDVICSPIAELRPAFNGKQASAIWAAVRGSRRASRTCAFCECARQHLGAGRTLAALAFAQTQRCARP